MKEHQCVWGPSMALETIRFFHFPYHRKVNALELCKDYDQFPLKSQKHEAILFPHYPLLQIFLCFSWHDWTNHNLIYNCMQLAQANLL